MHVISGADKMQTGSNPNSAGHDKKDSGREGRIWVVAAVIEREGYLLIGQRAGHKRYGGKWEFPGGKLEPGEAHHEAIRRELWEELRVRVVASQLPHFTTAEADSGIVIEYVSTTIEGTAEPREHQALAWVAVSDLLRYDLAPSDRTYAEFRLRQSIPGSE